MYRLNTGAACRHDIFKCGHTHPYLKSLLCYYILCGSVLLVILKESRFDRLYTAARPPSFVQLDIFNHVGVFA